MERIAKGIWKTSFGTAESHTPCSMRAFPIKKEHLEAIGEENDLLELPGQLKQLTFRKTSRGIQVRLPMETSEDIYGFGLQLRSMNQAGRKRRIRVNSDPPADTGEGHAPVPFYISTAGYGLLVDTFRYVDFYMGTNARKGMSAGKKEIEKEHKEFSESALYALKKASEMREILIEIDSAPGADIYLFAGSPMEIVQRYNLFSGGGSLPPIWGLGIWYRCYGGSNQEDVLRLAESFREEEMPVDVLGLEPGWHSHSYSCTYAWSYLFPDPAHMIEETRRNGYKLNLWEHMFVHPAAEFYDEITPYSGDFEVWNGLVPDFATEEARQIFSDYHREHFVKQGIAGFKLDECDNSDYNASNWSFPDGTQFPSGMDGEQMHMAVGTLYQSLLYDIFHTENKRTLSQVRSSGALVSSFPFVLYSDLYDHRQFIRGMVTSGFSGILWSPEVRSCKNEQDLLRRMETVCFSAHALFNCWRIPNPPWKQVDIAANLEGRLMDSREECTEVCRRYFRIRMQLLPYLYTAFALYHQMGIPPIRALLLDWPEDERLRGLDSEYMLGDALLVAPLVLEDGTSRKVYLPKGKWYDFFDGTCYEGGQEYEVQADYDQIPVFVKGASILPLAEPVQCVREDTVFDMTLTSYGENCKTIMLYEDDFETFAYEEGKYNLIEIAQQPDGSFRGVRSGKERVRYRFLNAEVENLADGNAENLAERRKQEDGDL